MYVIFVLKFTEPEAEVYNYSKIFIRVGIVVLLSRAKRLLPAPVSFHESRSRDARASSSSPVVFNEFTRDLERHSSVVKS